jgi:RimJ/RimL family protein N-acetyltransferase
MINPFLIGERIYLRPLELEDAETFIPWINDQEVIRTLGIAYPRNLLSERRWIENLYQDDRNIVLGIVVKEGDRLIGSTSLHRIDYRNGNAMFGILIGAKEEWGKGYGTEVTRLMVRYGFEVLNLHRIYLYVYAHNLAGISAYTRAGFQQEGVLREHYYRDGRYYDVILMGILRQEWQEERILAGEGAG